MTLEELALRASRFRWIEARLFEILGGWVQGLPEPEAQAFCSTVSYHHAWHAELWEKVTPASVLLRAMPVEPNAALASLFDALAAIGETTTVKLAGVYRVVLPRLATAYRTHREVADPIADAPVIRVLDLAYRDLIDDWVAGEGLLQSLVRTPDEVRQLALARGEFEAQMVAVGGLV